MLGRIGAKGRAEFGQTHIFRSGSIMQLLRLVGPYRSLISRAKLRLLRCSARKTCAAVSPRAVAG